VSPDEERYELTRTIVNLTRVNNVLEAAVYAHPESSEVWHMIHVYEELAAATGEENPTFSAHIRAAAEAMDGLRLAHSELKDSIVTAAEDILKEDTD
jgi:hypothetical protein